MEVPLSQQRKAEDFRALHEGDPFVIPNPWDAGSARVLAALGFKALATTSAGFAFTLGRLDGDVTLDEVIEHIARAGAATDLPVSVDLENGYGPEPEDAALGDHTRRRGRRRRRLDRGLGPRRGDLRLDTRRSGSPPRPRRRAALDFPFTLTARAENHFRSNPDLDDTIARLQAYEQAGADVLYAPGSTAEEIRASAPAISKPLNVLGRPA